MFGIILDFFQAKVERFLNVSTLSSLISVEVQINVELELFFSFMKVKIRGVGAVFFLCEIGGKNFSKRIGLCCTLIRELRAIKMQIY